MELVGPTSWDGEVDDSGYRTYHVTWLVRCGSRLDGPDNALATPGVPQVGSVWAIGNDLNTYVWCRYTSQVKEWKPTQNRPNKYFLITQNFSNKPNANPKCQDQSITDPLLEPPKVAGNYVNTNREGTYDRFGKPIKTSSHELIRGHQNEWPEGEDEVTIEQNLAVLNLPLLSALRNCVNSETMWGLPPRRIRLAKYSWGERYYGQCYKYFYRKIDFSIKYEGHDRDFLDEGTKVLRGHFEAQLGTGSGAAQQWVLDPIGGDPPSPLDPTHFIRFQDVNGNMCRVVLDGQGKPANSAVYPEISFIERVASNSPVVIITTNTAHGLTVGNKVKIVGVNPPAFNGTFTVTAVNSSTLFRVEDLDSSGQTFVSGGAVVNLDGASNQPGSIHVEKFNEADLVTLLGLPPTIGV